MSTTRSIASSHRLLPSRPLSRPSPPTYRRPFTSSSPLAFPRTHRRSHYEELGLHKGASKKEIKEKFHELSKQWHPDAPSTSTSTRESRTAKFQSLSESYSVLSDDSLRRQYDQSLSGFGSGSGSGPRRPTYTSGTRNEAGTGSGWGGQAGAAWSTDNSQRRDRANYAWAHPTNKRRSSAEEMKEEAEKRSDPFASARRSTPPGTSGDPFHSFAAREARLRNRHSNLSGRRMGGNSQYGSSTAIFGEKAEEESRLINDSSVARSGQVFLTFAGVFLLSLMFARSGHDKKDKETQGSRQRTNR